MAIQHINTSEQTRSRSNFKQCMDRVSQRTGDFLMNQWATIVTVLLGLLVLVALSIPFLSFLGFDDLSKRLFFSLHYVCAQIPSHSFYILGHQLGLCARNLSIYTSMFLGSLLFVLTKKRFPGIPWWLWVLMILPMAWDGGTQMFGLRESTPFLRVLTGTLFGLGSVWFALPMMHKTLLETTPPPTPGRLQKSTAAVITSNTQSAG